MRRTTLQPDHGALARTDLPPSLTAGIEAARTVQRESPAWEERDGHRALRLPDDVTFLPDESEALTGGFSYVLGIVLCVLGIGFSYTGYTDRKAEAWMIYVGPLLLAFGAYLFWAGRKKNRAASDRPRLFGAYLVGNVLLYHADTGCRIFPARSILGFEWASLGSDNASRLYVEFVNAQGRHDRRQLSWRNMKSSLDAWLHEHRASSTAAR